MLENLAGHHWGSGRCHWEKEDQSWKIYCSTWFQVVFLFMRFPFPWGKCGSKAKNIYFAFLENEVEEILFHWLYNRAGRMPSDRKPLSPSFDQNRTSQYHWTQCPNISGCQRSFFSPFSEQNVPILESFWVEQNVPMLLNTMSQYFLMSGVLFLSVFRTERPNISVTLSGTQCPNTSSCHGSYFSLWPLDTHHPEKCLKFLKFALAHASS